MAANLSAVNWTRRVGSGLLVRLVTVCFLFLTATLTIGSGASARTYTYTHDARDRLVSVTATKGTGFSSIGYNAAGRLATATAGEKEYAYTWDTQGNRLTGPEGMAFTVFGALDQLSAYTGAPATYRLAGKVHRDALVTFFHPAAPGGENITAIPPPGGSPPETPSSFSGSWPKTAAVPPAFQALVRAVLPGAGVNGTDAIAEKLLHYAFRLRPSGNLTHTAAGELKSNGSWKFSWDSLGRLSAAERDLPPAELAALPPDQTAHVEYVYDNDGRLILRAEKNKAGTALRGERLLWADWLPVLEEKLDGTGAVTSSRRFVWGLDNTGSLGGSGGIGGLLAVIENGENGRTLLPLDDGLGNIRALVDENGAEIASCDYGPFGEEHSIEGEAGACPFGWQSKWRDPVTGMVYFGHRWYDSSLGRWMSRDPSGESGGFNLSEYCGGDPLNRWDLLGMEWRVGPAIVDGNPVIAYAEHTDSAFTQFWRALVGGEGPVRYRYETPTAEEWFIHFTRDENKNWVMRDERERFKRFRQAQMERVRETLEVLGPLINEAGEGVLTASTIGLGAAGGGPRLLAGARQGWAATAEAGREAAVTIGNVVRYGPSAGLAGKEAANTLSRVTAAAVIAAESQADGPGLLPDPGDVLKIGVRAAKTPLARLQGSFDDLAEQHLLPQFLALDPNLKAGYTGSFRTGTVGARDKPTFGQPIDLKNFDVDYWIESDVLYQQFGKKLQENPAFRKILSETPGFEGLRPGRSGFTIKFKPSGG